MRGKIKEILSGVKDNLAGNSSFPAEIQEKFFVT
jgi:hypothetical protein